MTAPLNKCIWILFLFFFATDLSAQTPDLLPGELWRSDNQFYQGPQEIERDSFWSLVEGQAESRALFRKGDRQELGGTALIVGGAILTGGGLLVALTGSLLEGEANDNTGATLVTVAGLGTLIGGIAMLSSSRKNIERSIDKYNEIVVDQKRLGLYLGSNGVGIRVLLSR